MELLIIFMCIKVHPYFRKYFEDIDGNGVKDITGPGLFDIEINAVGLKCEQLILTVMEIILSITFSQEHLPNFAYSDRKFCNYISSIHAVCYNSICR